MRIRRALGLSAFAQLVTFILGFASVVIVSRLLTPAEIGIFSVAVSILGFAHVFREFGVGQYLIQAEVVGREQLRAAFSVTLFFSWSISIILFTARTPIASFYNHEGIAAVLALLSFNFVILPFGTPLLSLLQREMKFGQLVTVRIVNSLLSTAVTIGAAYAGESYLSMAWGAIAGHMGNIVLLNILRRGEIFMLPTTRGLREVMRFGSKSSLSSVLSELGSSMPDLIFGKTLGFSDVAYFSRAVGLRKMVLGQLSNLIRGVHFPAFAKSVREGADPAELYCQTMRYMVAVTAPAMALCAILAEPLILLLFGPQWERSAPIATLICLYAMLTTPYAMSPSSLVAAGHVSLLLRLQIILETARASLLITSIWLELEHVIICLGALALIETALHQNSLRKAFRLSFWQLLHSLRASLLLVPIAALGPLLLQLCVDTKALAGIALIAYLTTTAALGIFGWIAGVHITAHPFKSEIDNLIDKIREALNNSC